MGMFGEALIEDAVRRGIVNSRTGLSSQGIFSYFLPDPVLINFKSVLLD